MSSLFECCFGKKKKKKPGEISAEDMRRMLAYEKRKNTELKKDILRLEDELEFASTTAKSSPSVTTAKFASITITTRNEKYSGWVKILRTDQQETWRSVWACARNGRLSFYREASIGLPEIFGVTLSANDWKLHFRDGVSKDSKAVSEFDLPFIIVLNVLDDGAEGFYSLYINTGSVESKNEWMRALELGICTNN